MNWFKKLKVGAKFFLGFSVMILFMSIIGITGYISTGKIQQQIDEIFNIRLPSIDFLIETDRDLQQLLVDERSMIFANVKSDVFKNLVADYEENLAQADTRWEKYKTLATTFKEKEIIPKYEQTREEWKTISRKVVDGRITDTRQGRREALDLSLGLAKEKFENMRDYLDRLTGINLNIAKEAHEAASATYRKTVITLLSVSGIALLMSILLMWLNNQGVTKPLKRVIEELTEAADQVASGSNHVSSASQSLAEGASEQAASIEETSSFLEEMSSMTKQNAGNANQADNLMKEANQVVNKANDSMTELTGSMEEISKASEETSKIIKTIDEIAFQTNLLALNAAVEAARAGEAGAGFAVVADEVRNLAMRAADAAKNTADLIEGTVKKVKDGGELVATTNEAFAQVAESASKVGELVGEIAAASNEQAEGIEQVNKAVVEMDKVVQQNAANAEESASAAEEMNAQAELMKSAVDDLVAFVGGSTQKMGKAETVDAKPQAAGRHKALAAPSSKQNVTRSGEVKPEQVIPMEDEDFRDF